MKGPQYLNQKKKKKQIQPLKHSGVWEFFAIFICKHMCYVHNRAAIVSWIWVLGKSLLPKRLCCLLNNSQLIFTGKAKIICSCSDSKPLLKLKVKFKAQLQAKMDDKARKTSTFEVYRLKPRRLRSSFRSPGGSCRYV